MLDRAPDSTPAPATPAPATPARPAPAAGDQVLVFPDELLGDGAFETVHLRPSGPWLLDRHLDRLAHAAGVLGLPLPPRDEVQHRIDAAVTGWSGAEAALRIQLTRRALHVTVSPLPAAVIRQRRDGIRVISAELAPRPPWYPTGIKCLSYGENLAALRWTRERGADDLLWISPTGHALEAPTASVVWLSGTTLATVPAAATEILPGTTAEALLALAGEVGLQAEERMVTLADLAGADAIWLTSTLRGMAEVRSLDGAPREASPWTPRLLDLLGFAQPG